MSFVKSALFIYNLLCAVAGIIIMIIGGLALNVVKAHEKLPIAYDMRPPALSIIILGAIVCGIALVGCFGVLTKSECMTNLYACILLVFIVLQIAFSSFVYFYSNDAAEGFYEGYKVKFQNSEDVANRHAIDIIQEELHCCGLTGVMDWLPNPPPESCGQSKVGCRDELLHIIKKTFNILIWASLSAIGIEFFGLVLACFLSASLNDGSGGILYSRLNVRHFIRRR